MLVLIRDIVRKKAVMVLHSFYMKNPSAIPDVRQLAKKSVSDNDLGVVSSALHIFYELIKVYTVYMQVIAKATCMFMSYTRQAVM